MANKITIKLDEKSAKWSGLSTAHGLRIVTIDSLSWAIHSGYKEDANLLGSFDENLEKTIKLVKENEGVFGYPYSYFRFRSVS